MIKAGGEFEEFLRRQNLPEISHKNLVDSSTRILKRTQLLDGGVAQSCQLVLGEVQSGKTMSFTSLIALAHENGFPLVIVLGGTKKVLLSQTSDRLRRDLQTSGNGGANPWVLIEKPEASQHAQNLTDLQRALKVWHEADAPEIFKPTVVITALKNYIALDTVTSLVSDLKSRFDIDKFPVLIIDDEGDQAGLNLDWRNDSESANYAAIGRLRNSLSRHSFVMYTATPQGPLLINIADALSPKYVTVLRSGPDYLGGEELFINSETFTRQIPNLEAGLVFDPAHNAAIPPSLKKALAYFLLALQVAQNRTFPKPMSMLIHPSSTTDLHESYFQWVESVLASWESILRSPDELVYEKEIADFFLPAEVELKKSTELPESWDLHESLQEIRWWISKIQVRKINKDHSDFKSNEWMSKAGWILIGGNKLERGFTIENLAVTYMPRSTGGGNVDVIQQRGRFFGYKRKYSDLLRGWFFQDHIQAYIDYVAHEKSIRDQMITLDEEDLELTSWRRRFFLDPAYNPVRAQVISLGISHRRLANFKQQMLFDSGLSEYTESLLSRAYQLAENLTPFPNDKRVDRKNFYALIPIESALALMTDWKMSAENRLELDDDIWALRNLVDEGHISSAAIALMDWDESSKELIVGDRSMVGQLADPRKETEKQNIANLFGGPGGPNYPGDREMFVDGTLTIQIHKVRPIYESTHFPIVAALAVIIPSNTKGYVVEAEG